MIQRIQSIYLLIAVILIAVADFFPIAHCHMGTGFYTISALGVESSGLADYGGTSLWCWLAAAMSVVSVIFIMMAIFGYKDRIGQMRNCVFAMIAIIIYYVFFGIEVYEMYTATNVFPDLGLIAELPLIAIIFIFLAGRAIKRDEDLVRSMDRIR